MIIKILPAYAGDCLIIQFGVPVVTVVIDGGTAKTYSQGLLKLELEQIGVIDLLILTHVDNDHIGGFLKFFSDPLKKCIIRKVIFNSGSVLSDTLDIGVPFANTQDTEMSVKQGITLEKYFIKEGLLIEKRFVAGEEYEIAGAKFEFLSPQNEDLNDFAKNWQIEADDELDMSSKKLDYNEPVESLLKKSFNEIGSLQNKTSLAFLLTQGGKKVLFLGDAFPSVVEGALRQKGFNETNKLKVDYVKLSHHGSKHNTSPGLTAVISCNHFIISTNGSNGNPSKECLSRVIQSQMNAVNFYFNYYNKEWSEMFTEQEASKYNMKMVFLTNIEPQYTIRLK